MGLCFQTNTTLAEESAAERLYEAAFKLIVEGNYGEAYERLDEVIAQYPGTVYARFAGERKQQLERLNLLDIRRKKIDQSGRIETVVFSTLYSMWLGIGTARLIDGEMTLLRLQPKPISGASRASLVGFSTLFTTWLGVGTLIILEPEDPVPYGIALIAGPLTGLIGSLNLTQDIKLSDGPASLITLGGAWGIWQATGAAIIADMDEKAVVGASMAGGVLGLALSSSIVKDRNISPGDATLINFGGIWGTWFALCGAMVADVEDEDLILASAMIGGDVGLLTMAAWAPELKMSRARARLINISGIVGVLYGLGTSILLEADSERTTWGIMGIGGILGLGAGAYLTRHYDAEAGYFAESGLSLLNLKSGERKWGLPLPVITVSHLDSKKARAPNLKLQVPLVRITF